MNGSKGKVVVGVALASTFLFVSGGSISFGEFVGGCDG